jgi:hypothetical protein
LKPAELEGVKGRKERLIACFSSRRALCSVLVYSFVALVDPRFASALPSAQNDKRVWGKAPPAELLANKRGRMCSTLLTELDDRWGSVG